MLAPLDGDGSRLFPILHEATPVRMDLTHSGWSDIFFLGMDFPEGARVLNVSIDLAVRGAGDEKERAPKPPVEAFCRVIDKPVLRLVSVDLGASAEITSLAEVFDFAKDYLGLLKAAVIAAGVVPPGMEGADQPLADLLARLIRPGYGLEIVSQVNDIPKGSRLAVSTNLLASLIAVLMRATGQTAALTGPLSEARRIVAAPRHPRGMAGWLGRRLAGFGRRLARHEVDPGRGSRSGRSGIRHQSLLLPDHTILTHADVAQATRQRLQESLVLVHGGMAQDVGPILEMVTEKYLLRSEAEWQGRQEAMAIYDEIVELLRQGDVPAIGAATERNFRGPIQTIIPWASNLYTETLIARVRAEFGADFWGFWMLGGMAGGGMGFIFAPEQRRRGQERLQAIMAGVKAELEGGVPFAMEPVVYDFAINERTVAELLCGDAALHAARLLHAHHTGAAPRRHARAFGLPPRRVGRVRRRRRTRPELAGMVQILFDQLIPQSAGATDDGRTLTQLLDARL
ncbi:MAG: hypothetical protein R2854_27200 [Caldilineaceae bacterium]